MDNMKKSMCVIKPINSCKRSLTILLQLLKMTQVVTDPLTEPGHMLGVWLQALRADSPSLCQDSGWTQVKYPVMIELLTSQLQNSLLTTRCSCCYRTS